MADRVPITPPPGLNSDTTQFAAPGQWFDGTNIRFFHGQPECIGGFGALQSGAAETYTVVRDLFAYDISGVAKVAVGRALSSATTVGSGAVQLINTANWTKTDIGPGAAMSAVPEDFSFAMFGDILLFAPGNQTLYESSAGAAATAVAAAPDNITAMVVTPSRQVMALGCNEEVSTTFNGRCIRWCDIEDYTDWTTLSSNNAGEYILPGQENIIGGGVVGNHIVIWTEGAIWLGEYVGEPGQTFVFSRIDGKGLIAKRCWAEWRGTVYWLSPELKFYSWSPGSLPTEVPCPIWNDAVLAQDSYSNRQYYRAFANRRYGEIWFSIGFGFAVSPVIFCADESLASQRAVWGRATGYVAYVDSPLLAGVTGMGDSTIIAGGSGTSSGVSLKAIDQRNNLASLTVPTWDIESSFFYLDEGGRRVQIQKMTNDEKGNYGSYSLELKTRRYPDDTYEYEDITITNNGVTNKADMRVSGHLISAQFFNSSGTGHSSIWRLGKPVFETVLLGKR